MEFEDQREERFEERKEELHQEPKIDLPKEERSEEHRTHHHKKEGSKTEKLGSDRFWKITTVVLIAVLAFFVFKGNPTGGIPIGDNNIIDDTNDPTPEPTPVINMAQLADDDAVEGNADAPVTIIQFSDFQCPYCARFFAQTLPQIRENYIETGKVKLIHRDFPLSFHENAQKAAEAAECAGEQGKYYEMHDLLYGTGVTGGVDTFKQYAQDLGLDTAEFNACLDNGDMAAEVAKDMQDGIAAGVKGTPAFIINGVAVNGAQPYEVFEQVIEAALQG